MQKEVKIADLFNNYWAFDSLMIAYFRSLNYEHVKKHHADRRLKDFIPELNLELRKISTFYEESEGVELESLAWLLGVKLSIYFAGENNKIYKYNEGGKDLGFKLFYRPGHYDIVYT